MIINNFDKIRNLLVFPPKDNSIEYFYVVQLIQRSKDNPSESYGNPNYRNNANRSLYQTYIYSLEDFDNKFPLLIKLANVWQSRIYINLNIKSSYDSFINLMDNCISRLKTKNYLRMSRIYNHAVGDCKGSALKSNRWIIDYDKKDENELYILKSYLNMVKGSGSNGHGQCFEVIPTRSGYHLITSSFDTNSYNNYLLNHGIKVDIHKDNPTILWMNTNWSE